jgi:branched-chain amino acid transport system substrate-binding protein
MRPSVRPTECGLRSAACGTAPSAWLIDPRTLASTLVYPQTVNTFHDHLRRCGALPGCPRLGLASLLLLAAFVWAPVLPGSGALGLGLAPVHAQSDIPRLPRAELAFEEARAAFERGDFGEAADEFRSVTEFPLNRKTTAAFVMAAKARYRQGNYREVLDLVETLLERFPETSYRADAEKVRAQAREGLRLFGQRADTLRVGVVLPMRDRDADLTQSFFHGMRLAVDEHNGVRRRYVLPRTLQQSRAKDVDVFDTADMYGDSLATAAGATTIATRRDTVQVDSLQIVTEQTGEPRYIAKMFFRSVGEQPSTAGAAVDSLVRLDRVDVLVGPLYSDEARAAARVAESNRVVMIAPLATDQSVSEGRQYVFQANPTISMRGRRMARFAAESLLLRSTGIIHEESEVDARQIANGFAEEARQIGLQVPYRLELSSRRDWSRLPGAFEADSTLTDSIRASAESVYLPIMGRDAQGKIQDALAGLKRFGTSVRVIGNAQWHDLSVRTEASEVRATYANDFYIDTARNGVQTFIRRFRLLTGNTPDDLSVTGQRLAYTGHDVTRFLLQSVEPGRARPRPEAIRRPPRYNGLGVRIDFDEQSNINHALFFHRYRDGNIELLN